MSYSEQDGKVVLTMSPFAAADPSRWALNIEQILLLMNRLNQGNPNYTPYQTGEAK